MVTESHGKDRPLRSRSPAVSAPSIPEDPLSAFGLSPQFPEGFRPRCSKGTFVPASDISWALGGIEAELKPLYQDSALTWDKREKRAQLRAAQQRLLFLDRNSAQTTGVESTKKVARSTPEALLSYRVDKYDEDCENKAGTTSGEPREGAPVYCVYVYELFVAETARRLGLARGLMTLLEKICACAGIERIVLTVFDQNAAALNLYKECLGYTNDPNCPSRHNVAGANYQILSKTVRPRPQET